MDDVEFNSLDDKQLKNGFNREDDEGCIPFRCYTKNRIYFSFVYDSFPDVFSISRNPCDEEIFHVTEWMDL